MFKDIMEVKGSMGFKQDEVDGQRQAAGLLQLHPRSGTNVEMLGITSLRVDIHRTSLLAGQRYSFVLTANQIVGNYWIRPLAILRYAGAPKADPKTSSVVTQPLVETLLHPLMPSRAPGNPYPSGADYNIQLELGLDLPTFKFLVNGTVC
ncbi:hypothetical protein B0H17DRAFT_1208437 [Mycena rosella]|uniref:Plastocyanin-like domain-containing protein n=1 Tax=Mycena rosella TaxID=1033263 RepID=A0AAD7D0L8_MYCRO|nr:hypothetical protein B0H17DRAFT_1208437 [Mycena rosella]